MKDDVGGVEEVRIVLPVCGPLLLRIFVRKKRLQLRF